MTLEEEIEILSNELIVITDMIGYCKDFEKESDLALAYRVKRQEAHKIAISVLKEIQQYHKIGTVEECREAMEKQKPKKPHKNYEKFSGLWCKCGWYLGQKTCLDIKYWPNCGQAIFKEKSEEE